MSTGRMDSTRRGKGYLGYYDDNGFPIVDVRPPLIDRSGISQVRNTSREINSMGLFLQFDKGFSDYYVVQAGSSSG